MNIIVTVFIVLFVLGFIMMLVIANRLHDDYEEKLKHIEQTQEFIVDSLQEQRNTHTITVDDTNEEKVEDVSTINFESK